MANDDVAISKYLKLKARVEKAQQKADKAEGALDEVLKQIKKDFNCNTINEAKRKLKQLKNQSEKLQIEFNKAIEQFEEKWDVSESEDED